MIFKMYSVHDTLANIYYMPFQTGAVEVAIRTFSDLVNDPDQSVYAHPKDYNLVQIGSFDDSTGLLNPLPRPEIIATALTLHQDYQS